MKRYVKALIAALVISMLGCVLFSCNNDNVDNKDAEATREVEQLFTNYFKDLNDKNFSAISAYYSSDNDTDMMIASLEFNSNMFEITYELDNVIATFVDDGNIGATVDFKQTSKNLKNSSKVTVTMEHHTYLITKENDKYVIKTVAVGEGDLISNS